jgi:prepilin-type N-terminal cleavage/methylation domain-containing protein/prepilin-type processing-associated H-X9-DG protein
MNIPIRSQRCAAFTLIELLIVIAIITLLAAILFPVFARARENARRASCQSNEKQIALGLIQYSQDYDERLPHYTTDPDEIWFNAIYPYVKNYQIFRCPGAPRYKGSFRSVNASVYCLPGLDNAGSRTVIYDLTGLHLVQVSEPARTFMVLESANENNATNYPEDGYGGHYCRLDTAGGAATEPEKGQYVKDDIHFDGYNVAFVDGHVKWMKSGEGKNWIFDLNRVTP